jgi:hypothetical protein
LICIEDFVYLNVEFNSTKSQISGTTLWSGAFF